MTARTRSHRRRSPVAITIATLLVVMLAVVTVLVRGPAIERDIEQRTTMAIAVQSIAFGSFEIEVDGRDVTLSGRIAEEHADYLRELIEGLQGVRSVTIDPGSIAPSTVEGA